MAVALVHDYLNQRGGAERVFAHIARAYPEAPVYTALFDPKATGDLVDPARVRASALARLPGVNRYFRYLAPLYPRVFESFDFSAYDTIVSSTTAWAKGIRVPPGAVHVCYINTVSRFTFAYDRYVGGFGPRALARPFVRGLVAWDLRAAQRPTLLVANSANVAERIRRYYGRDAEVLRCPVDVARFTAGPGAGEYFVVASRLLPYKRIDLAIRAAQIANVPLLVAGCGPAE
ncbi:MAG: glycosyltransferase, partial [Vulcanimicrobiaceae bacterium]